MTALQQITQALQWTVTPLPENERPTKKTAYFALGLLISTIALNALGKLGFPKALFAAALSSALLLGSTVAPIPLFTKGPYILGVITLIAYEALKIIQKLSFERDIAKLDAKMDQLFATKFTTDNYQEGINDFTELLAKFKELVNEHTSLQKRLTYFAARFDKLILLQEYIMEPIADTVKKIKAISEIKV